MAPPKKPRRQSDSLDREERGSCSVNSSNQVGLMASWHQVPIMPPIVEVVASFAKVGKACLPGLGCILENSDRPMKIY